MIDSGADLFRW